MKLIEHNSRILFKVSDNKTSEEIKNIIKNKIENNTYEENIKFIRQLEDIEYFSGFSIDVSKYSDGEVINIYGDNGLLMLDIIDVKTIKELK
jgi:hypothetical protein